MGPVLVLLQFLLHRRRAIESDKYQAEYNWDEEMYPVQIVASPCYGLLPRKWEIDAIERWDVSCPEKVVNDNAEGLEGWRDTRLLDKYCLRVII